jgi:enoyl-CoA hydratase/carnithine racemase
MPPNDLATLTIDNNTARLTLNRPDARNALSLDLISAIRARIAELAKSNNANVCIITGAGKSFSAGMDLKAVLNEPGAPERLLAGIAELTLELRALPCVTLAKVNGAAIGGGCGLMCVCDIAITHPDAKIGYPEVDLGVCPAVVAPWLIARVGAGLARRILLAGGTMTGQQAHELGLVNQLADRDALDQATETIAERLASAAPNAIRATKVWMNQLDPPNLADNVRRGAMISTEVITSPEARASLEAVFSAGKR